MNMATGEIRHLPRAGGILDNDDFILTQMRYAWRTYYTWNLDHDKRENSDHEFMSWVMSKEV